MKLISKTAYSRFIPIAEKNSLCKVYPLSVAEGIQSGEIYTDSSESCVLIRHKNNFSFIIGLPGEAFLDEVFELVINDGMKLMCRDEDICGIFSKRSGIALLPRSFYTYTADTAPQAVSPEGYTARSIDGELFRRLEGRVAPEIFWKDHEEFRQSGRGICLMYGNEPASWAFTSAVSSTEADIGIETAEAHRRQGLALAAASLLIKELLPLKRPVWSCQQSNTGSAHTAERLGFVKYAECIMIKKADQAH